MNAPCIREQDVLFAVHRIGPAWKRLFAALHCLRCEQCRTRKGEFRATTRALMTLRPSLAPAAFADVPGSKRSRLIMCSAAIAIAAAALSYYLAFGEGNVGQGGGVGAKPAPNTGVSTCVTPLDAPPEVKRAALEHGKKSPKGSGRPAK
jgi:hypothetical protein